MKRVLALLLVLTMVLGILPMALAAEAQQPQTGVTVNAQEVNGESRLDERTASGAERPVEPLYSEDEIVTVIVQLEEPALMDYFSARPYSVSDETLSAGEAVSAFLTSADAQVLNSQLLEQQQAVIDEISGLQPAAFDLRSKAAAVEVTAQWTALTNAMAIKVPYGQLSAIQALDGVRNAYVEITYDRPEEPATQAGTAGYSYDMVGLNQVWEAGYTGEGMLVAILDTGLDLEWATYWDGSAGENVSGIRRVHEAFTADSFKTERGKQNVRWTESALTRFVEETPLAANTGADGQIIHWDDNALYKNHKVPFAADYADGDLNVRPTDSDHGTHVAGTVAGYAEDGEGAVLFSGIAPDAQILAMKVFPDVDGGATETAILNALNDAAKLGADVVNLSLGSDNGFAEDDSAANEAYGSLYEAGILLMTSAGNAAYSSANSGYGAYGLASNPEISMMSAPAVYDSNLSIASINNSVDVQAYFTWTDSQGAEHKVPYTDPTGVAMKYKFAGTGEYAIVPVDGYGTSSDYYNAGFRNYYGYGGDKGKTGIALVQRGGALSFADKINNASGYAWTTYEGGQLVSGGVQAVIVYDNVEGALINMSTDGTTLTSCFISKANGEAIVAAIEAGYDVKITVAEEDELVQWDSAGEMSSFSSWGAGPGLELKPEITAPGGNIWSSILDASYREGSGTYDDYTGAYGMMSGTSMAAPHMTGITALVKQYAMSKDGLKLSSSEAAALTDKLLVSTAVPQKNGETYYSPRLQGAGLVNAAAAISTPAYITVDGQNVGKLELKDDPDETGSYNLKFTVNNLTSGQLTYNAQAVLLRPDVGTENTKWGQRSLMLDRDVTIKTVDLGTVTVPANGSAAVNQTVTLSAAEKETLKNLFPNGTYVEGFVILTDVEGENPQIGLPFLAFFGDWTKAPIFDSASWLDQVSEGQSFLDGECTWWPTILGYYDGYNYYNLGQNIFDSSSGDSQTAFYAENITISPSGFFKTINDYELFQLREAKVMVVEVKDKATGALYYRDYTAYQFKTYYDANYGMGIPSSLYYFTNTDWDGTDLEGNVLPSGTQCVYTITAYGDGDYPTVWNEAAGRYVTDVEAIIPGEKEPTFNGRKMDMTGNVISFDVMVDTEAPTLVNNAVTIYEEDGRTYLTGTFTDEGSIASIEVAPVVTRTQKDYPDRTETKVSLSDAFYTKYIYDPDVDEYTFIADVTDYVHNETYPGESSFYDFTWTGDVYIYGGDYGGNDRAYAIAVENNTTEGALILSQTSALLHPGSEFDLSVIDNTGSNAPITRTSSNPEVATIDEYGHVVAIAPGQTTITVSNGSSTAVCIVAVEAYSTEVLDFDLSIDHFETLKPNGQIIVKVVNLQPADVVLEEINWSVSEDEETAENYEGLINCARYTTDGLQGEIYLNYSAYDTGDAGPIPGGSGTLTVTLNGVSRQMTIKWADLYKQNTDEDLVSDSSYGSQTIYVTQGETAALIAKYNDTTAHDYGAVALYTAEGYVYGGSSNPTEPATGLILDGPSFYNVGSKWTGKLVNEAGYVLPKQIHVIYRYDYGYEYELTRDAYYNGYTYDAATGEISVTAPYGTATTLVIRADGVAQEDAPAGTLSGESYETPEGLYGPFDWTLASGNGQLETFEGVSFSYSTKNGAYYTPAEPGVSYITAATKDGKYSVDFAVICEGVQAESLDLDVHSMELTVGETETLIPTLTPEPTLDSDKELIWTSFNPQVAAVDENGVVTGMSEGYAYIKAALKTNTAVTSYCLVHVTAGEAPAVYTVKFNSMGGSAVASQTVEAGGRAVRPADPVRAGFQFEGWYSDGSLRTSYDFDAPVTGNLTLYAKWSWASVIPTPTPVKPTIPSSAGSVNTGSTFVDVPASYWAHDAVEYVAGEGLFNGVSANRFDPEGKMTRAMLVTVLWRMEGKPAASYTGAFTDVADNTWYTTAVEWASANGIVNGVSPTAFAPDNLVTREQIAAILWRMEGKPAANGSLSSFPDGSSVSAYAQDAMIWAVEAGLFGGDTRGNLRPLSTATRAEVATLVQRYVDWKA